MAETSAIEWTDSTFNPWIGCTKISPACDHCYAEALMDTRHGRVKWGGERSRTSPGNWKLPRRWQKQAAAFFAEHGRRQRVFCSSLADVFDNQVPTEWRDDLWALIRDTPDLHWQLLTKRPQNIGKMLPAYWDEVKGHVWLGTTVEDQQRANLNIPHLLQHDSAVRFISVEPMLGPIDLTTCALGYFKNEAIGADLLSTRRPHAIGATVAGAVDALRGLVKARVEFDEPFAMTGDRTHLLDWVIAGSESGSQARPSHPDWFRSLRDQCAAAGVPFLFKQWGHWREPEEGEEYDTGKGRLASPPAFLVSRDGTVHCFEESAGADPAAMLGVGKKRAGRILDGVEHNGFPMVQP